VKESDKLPEKMINSYAATKLLAEQLVLSQNNNNFQTIALRPRAIIGAEDTVIFPRVLEAYNKGLCSSLFLVPIKNRHFF
jgi:nucleoside-diphosphate-sugar epimerase